MSDITFSMLLKQIMEATGYRYLTDVYRELQKRGSEITYSTLANYRSFNTVPTQAMAREILDVFGYKCSEEDLNEIIRYSSKELASIKSYDSERKYIQRGISLSPSYFSDGLTSDELINLMEARAEDISPEDKSISKYIQYLIKKDLQEQGLLGGQ